MRRTLILFAYCVSVIPIETRASRADDVEFSLPTPEVKLVAKGTDTAPIALPDVLEGVILDEHGSPLQSATVTFKIVRDGNPFEDGPPVEPEKWMVLTNEKGVIELAPNSNAGARAKMMGLFKEGKPFRDEHAGQTK